MYDNEKDGGSGYHEVSPINIQRMLRNIDEKECYSNIDWSIVQRNTAKLASKRTLPLVQVCISKIGKVILIDGLPQLLAHRILGMESIEAEIIPVSEVEAEIYVIREKFSHGLPLSKYDLPKTLKLVYEKIMDGDIRSSELTNKKVAEILGCAESTVRKYFKECTQKNLLRTETICKDLYDQVGAFIRKYPGKKYNTICTFMKLLLPRVGSFDMQVKLLKQLFAEAKNTNAGLTPLPTSRTAKPR